MVSRSGTLAVSISILLSLASLSSASFNGLLTGDLSTQCATAERYSAPGTFNENKQHCDRDYPFSGNPVQNKRHCARINPGYVGQFIDNAAPAGSIRCRFFEKNNCPDGFHPHKHFCIKMLDDMPRSYDEAIRACSSSVNLGQLIKESFSEMRSVIRRVDGKYPLLWWDGDVTEAVENLYGAHRMYRNDTSDKTAISVRAIESPRWDAPRIKKGSLMSMSASEKAYAVCTRRPKPSASHLSEICTVFWPTMGVPATFYSKSSTEQYCVWASHNPHAVNNARSHRHLHSACEVRSNMQGQAIVRGAQFDTTRIHQLYKEVYEMFTRLWQRYTGKATNPPNTFALRLPAFYDYSNDIQINTELDGSINQLQDVKRRSNNPLMGLNVVVKMEGGSVGTFDSFPGEWLPVLCAARLLKKDAIHTVYSDCAQGFMEFYWNGKRRCFRMYSAQDRHPHSAASIVNGNDQFSIDLALTFCAQIKDVLSNKLVDGRLARFAKKVEMDQARRLLQYIPPLEGNTFGDAGRDFYKHFPALGAYMKHSAPSLMHLRLNPSALKPYFMWRTMSNWDEDKVMTEDIWNPGEPNNANRDYDERCTHWTNDYYGYSCGGICYMNDVPCHWVRRALCEYTLAPATIVN